jgi:hypothetical protein
MLSEPAPALDPGSAWNPVPDASIERFRLLDLS